MKNVKTLKSDLYEFVRRLIREKKVNFPALVVCFSISCLIVWVYNSQKVESKTVSAELQIENNGNGGFIQSSPPSKQYIQISLKGENAELFDASDFTPYIDLSFVSSSGTQKLPVLLRLSDRAKSSILLETRCEPSHVEIGVDQIITGFIDVEPVIAGTPANGYEVKSTVIEPSRIMVKGPKSIIEGKNFVQTKAVNVSNARTSFKSENVGIEDTLFLSSVSDSLVDVEVEIVPVMARRTLNQISVSYKNIDPRLELSSVTDNISVDIFGNKSDVDSFSVPRDFVVVDCSSVHSAGKFNLPVSINVPSYLELTGEIYKNLAVSFNTKAVQVENKSVVEHTVESVQPAEEGHVEEEDGSE